MSLPTRIYLALIVAGFGAWIGWVFIGGAARAARPVTYASDPQYFLRHAHLLRGSLRGRVELAPTEDGDEVRIPEESLRVSVRARSRDGRVAVERFAPIDRWGVFEVTGLPYGWADVRVELGVGGELARVDDVRVRREARDLDARLDPIGLAGSVTPFELRVVDALGAPVEEGRIAWRAADWSDDSSSPFVGVAQVAGGRARFLSTSDLVDAVSLVPGLRADVYPAVAPGEELVLPPGAGIELFVEGPRPDPDEWRVLAHVESTSPIDVDAPLANVRAEGLPLPATALDEEGHAWLPVVLGGPYRLTWYVSKARRRTAPTIRVPDPGGDIDVVAAAGPQEFRRTFPMGEFLRRVNASD
ncbi:MAG: hypothetical protein AAFU73_13620 [Planctomycetota bacterium]